MLRQGKASMQSSHQDMEEVHLTIFVNCLNVGSAGQQLLHRLLQSTSSRQMERTDRVQKVYTEAVSLNKNLFIPEQTLSQQRSTSFFLFYR